MSSRTCWHCTKKLHAHRHHVVEDGIGVRHFVHAECAPATGLRLVAKWRSRDVKVATGQ